MSRAQVNSCHTLLTHVYLTLTFTGPKATGLKNLVRTLKSQGVPIDGVGLQSHFIVGQVPTTLVQNMQEFAALGVEVAITELDIRMTLPETAALLQQQKQDFQTVVAACQAVPACVGITLWDFTDEVCANTLVDVVYLC